MPWSSSRNGGIGGSGFRRKPGSARRENPGVGPPLDIVRGEAGGRDVPRFDGAGVQRPKEEIEQALAGRSIVEDLADERRLCRLLHEVRKPLRRLREPLEKERVTGGVARRYLRRMEVPALIEASLER